MKLVVKAFGELTARELLALLKARTAVFIVEQNCPYQDIDGWDECALHVFYEDGGKPFRPLDLSGKYYDIDAVD